MHLIYKSQKGSIATQWIIVVMVIFTLLFGHFEGGDSVMSQLKTTVKKEYQDVTHASSLP